MSKTIRVSEGTWLRLDELRKKGETFDAVVVKLLIIETKVRSLTAVGGNHGG